MKIDELYSKVRQWLIKRGNRSMAAVIYKRNTIYSIGYSSPIPHMVFVNKKVTIPSLHAEMDAYRRAMNEYVRTHKKKLTANILIVRYLRSNYYANSKPCKDCLKFMKTNINSISVKFLTYANDSCLTTEKLIEIKTSHISRGWKR